MRVVAAAGRRWGGRLIVGVVAVLALGACSTFAPDGEVSQGLTVGSGGISQVRVIYPGPVPDATEEQIIRGFVRAGGASDGEFGTARSFLTRATATAWDPDGEVVVLDGTGRVGVTPVATNQMRLTAVVVARITTDGRWVPAAAGTTRQAFIGLSRVAGQWRIGSLPKNFGRWVNDTDVPRLFRPFPIQFISATTRFLVPDLRWLPADHLPTRLARALLDGPPAYLRGAVTTAVPPDARLLTDAVTVTRGVAKVDLAGTLPSQQGAREDLLAQFVATVTAAPPVASVALTIDGAPVELPNAPGPFADATEVGFPPPPTASTVLPVLRSGETLVSVLPDGSTPPQPSGTAAPRPGSQRELPAIPAAFVSLALSFDGTEFAAVTTNAKHLSRWRAGVRYEVPGFASQLGAPSFDRRGFLWIGGQGASEGVAVRLWVIDPRSDPANGKESTAIPVRADWLGERRVLQAQVAADGARIAVLSVDAAGTGRVDIAGIRRSNDGVPQSLADPRTLATDLPAAHGLAWVDPLTVTTLTHVGSKAATTALLLSVGGQRTTLPPSPGAVRIVCAGGERAILVLTSAGLVLGRSGPGWVTVAKGIDLAFPAA